MARPRKATDDEVIGAALRVMSRVGPSRLTLAEIAEEAGLTAGALVQRFGSKRRLLLAIAALGADAARANFAELRASGRSPLAALRYYAECFGQMAGSPGALAHQFAYLELDLTDPDFRQHTLAQARATDDGLRALIADAAAAGELAPSIDAKVLSRAVQAMISGSLMTWAFYQRGSGVAWVREDLDTLLRPYHAAAARRGRARGPRPTRR